MKEWHHLVRDDGSVCLYYTDNIMAGDMVVYDSLDKPSRDELLKETREQGLTMVTLCAMVLGDDAADVSDDALIRGVRHLITERAERQDAAHKFSLSHKWWKTDQEIEDLVVVDPEDWFYFDNAFGIEDGRSGGV